MLFLALSCLGTTGVRNERMTWRRILPCALAGSVLYLGSAPLLHAAGNPAVLCLGYIVCVCAGYICLLTAGVWTGRLLIGAPPDDPFNVENESFQQETRLIENEYSVNLATSYYYRKQWRPGWINVVNPFRASIVLGTPGSGKSYAVVNQYIKQQIEKGFAMYVYDYKFPDLSLIAYNHLRRHRHSYKVQPKFYVINFDDPRRSHRCNPIAAKFMTDISDAYESAYTIMLNLNKTWIEKQGDFFVDSPIILLAAIIWFLKIYKDGRYCTFPHAIELLNKRYSDLFIILTSYPSLENYLSPFMDAWKSGAQDQLQGQIASAKIPLSRLISPQLYWVMSGEDFTLDINNPDEPKILCIGNNPDRQSIYGAALGLYNSRIVRLINQKGKLKSSIIIDELPTIYFRGLDNLIATARSNKVAVCLGFQDFSQLERDYGEKEAKVTSRIRSATSSAVRSWAIRPASSPSASARTSSAANPSPSLPNSSPPRTVRSSIRSFRPPKSATSRRACSPEPSRITSARRSSRRFFTPRLSSIPPPSPAKRNPTFPYRKSPSSRTRTGRIAWSVRSRRTTTASVSR